MTFRFEKSPGRVWIGGPAFGRAVRRALYEGTGNAPQALSDLVAALDRICRFARELHHAAEHAASWGRPDFFDRRRRDCGAALARDAAHRWLWFERNLGKESAP